jgi:general secretion pathway protein I
MARLRRGTDGFTLVEVLVAVAVLAIAMAAVIGAMARQADNAGYLKQKTLALWVAHNRLAEVQLQTRLPDLGRSDGTAQMGGFDWTWEAVVVATEDPRLRRIDIVVRPPEDERGSLAQITGFLAVPP